MDAAKPHQRSLDTRFGIVMKKVSLNSVVLVALFLLAAIAAKAQDPSPTPIEDDTPETVFTEEIKVNVAAFDRFGDFFGDVKNEDLIIVEDGRLHQPTSVRRIPANVLIVLDTGGEHRQIKNISNTRDAAKELIRRLSPETRISLLEYHDKARVLTHWTTDRADLQNDLDNKLFFGRRSIFSAALELATTLLENPDLENTHLVLISDGTDSLWSDERRAKALRGLLKTNISVHVISYTRMELTDIEPRTKGISKPTGTKTLPQEVIDTLPIGVREVANTPKSVTVSTDREFIKTMKQRKQALKDGEAFMSNLSESTNGLFILPDDTDEMLEKTRLVARAIDNNYVVTYTPKRPLRESEPGEIRVIEVTSKKPGLIVQAKRRLAVGVESAAESEQP